MIRKLKNYKKQLKVRHENSIPCKSIYAKTKFIELFLTNERVYRFLDLTTQVSKLKAELNSLKVRECEAQERIIELGRQLDDERRNRSAIDVKLKVGITPFVMYP